MGRPASEGSSAEQRHPLNNPLFAQPHGGALDHAVGSRGPGRLPARANELLPKLLPIGVWPPPTPQRRRARRPRFRRSQALRTSGGWGIRTPEGFHPTRFPSVRHRPLGESSWPHEDTGPRRGGRTGLPVHEHQRVAAEAGSRSARPRRSRYDASVLTDDQRAPRPCRPPGAARASGRTSPSCARGRSRRSPRRRRRGTPPRRRTRPRRPLP